ncbi:MAG: TraB/GumN family protein, partial [Candidatus Altarchaeaceae archaeon]
MIEKISKGDREIYLIGTAHVSRQSVEEVKNFINNENPDAVCVELCEQRYNALKNKEKFKNMNIEEIIKEGKFQLFILNLLLASFQKKIGKD